jgi:hypothetical protein
MDTHALLEKWRYLIEPELVGCATPLAWADLLRMPVQVIERDASVMVTHDTVLGGILTRTIVVVCGVMPEVREMVEEMEAMAVASGITKVMFIGRRGWLRAFPGYREIAVLGAKELI